MTTRFVGLTSGVWAAGTPQAQRPDSAVAYSTLSLALAAAAAGDLILVAPGSYTLPATVGVGAVVRGYSATLTTLTPAGGGTAIAPAGGHTCRFEDAAFSGRPVVTGKAVFVRCAGGAGDELASAVGPGAMAVGADCTTKVLNRDGGCASNFACLKTRRPGAGGRNPAEYRTAVEVLAPVYKAAGGGGTRPEGWLVVGTTRCRLEERSGSEATNLRTLTLGGTGRAYLRAGVPMHQRFRLRVGGDRTLEVKAALLAPPPASEFEVHYTEAEGRE